MGNRLFVKRRAVLASLWLTLLLQLVPRAEHPELVPAGGHPDCRFRRPTMMGAIPVDDDGDEIPNRFDEKATQALVPCANFFREETLLLIGELSTCQWVNNQLLEIQLTADATGTVRSRVRQEKTHRIQTPSASVSFKVFL